MNSNHASNPPASQSDIKSLDTIRRSLLTLTNSLTSLQHTLSAPPAANAPLPPWSSLQNSFALLTGNLLALSEHLDSSRDFLTRAHAYPLPNFPGREQEALLSQLLKKKADVDVEKWMRNAEEQGEKVGSGTADSTDGHAQGPASEVDMVALWDWALQAAAQAAEGVPWGIDVTVDERERDGGVDEVKLRSGLKRELKVRSDREEESEGDDGEGDEKEEDEMEVDGAPADAQTKASVDTKQAVAPMIPIEDVLKFMITGAGGEAASMTMSGALG